MIQHFIFIVVFLLFQLFLRAQNDSIVVYDIATQQSLTIPPVPFNNAITFDKTSSSVGTMGDASPVNQVPPVSNVFPGSNFSRLARASDFFSLTSYPARTAVALRAYNNGTASPNCSGMIVGPCFVLVSAYCVYDLFTKSFPSFDSLRVCPAYNNGMEQPGLPRSTAKKIYIFKSAYRNVQPDDMALLELREPIGIETGWTGIGFSASPLSFIAGKTFHKLSYPSQPSPIDPTEVYNGDTLYYNYGLIDYSNPFYMVPSNMASGIPGQAGSTFMYYDGSDYFSIGLSLYSSSYIHSSITNRTFYQLKNVLDLAACSNYYVSLKDDAAKETGFQLYPNPVSHSATLQLYYNPANRYSLSITDALGRRAAEDISVNGHSTVIAVEKLSAGLYFLQLRINGRPGFTGKMIVE